MKKLMLAVAVTMLASQAFAGFGTRGGRYAARAVLIQFASLGAGIDSRVVGQINSVVQQQDKKGLISMITSTPWGREGEFDLCVEYKEFTDAYASEKHFAAVATNAKAPVHVKIVFNCTDARP